MLTKSNRGARGLGDQTVEDDGDTFQGRGGGVSNMLLQAVWWGLTSKSPADVFWVYASKPG
jgi:hypothetical protein